MGTKSDIALLLERQAVVETATRLFVSVDRRDWKGVADVLADEVLFDMSLAGGGPGARLTAQAIIEGWEKALRPIQEIHHQAGNHLVEIRGERAKLFCYGMALHDLPNPSGRNTRAYVGSDDYDLEKLEGRWRITAFRFNQKFLEGNLELESAK